MKIILALMLSVAMAQAATLSVANYPSIQDTINAAAHGDAIYIPAGWYDINTTIIIDRPLTIFGDGPYSSRVHYLPTTGDALRITTPYPVILMMFGIIGRAAGSTDGALLVVDPGTGKENIGSSFILMNMENGWQHINIQRAGAYTIRECTLANSAAPAQVFIDNIENADHGDVVITGCVITNWRSASSQISLIYQRGSGGLRISNNKLYGGTYGYRMGWGGNKGSGILKIWGNSIENQDSYGITIQKESGASTGFTSVSIIDNEISSGAGIQLCNNSPASQSWLQMVRVSSNDILIRNKGAYGIEVGNIRNFRIHDNSVLAGGSAIGTATGYKILSNARDGVLYNNSARGCQRWVSGSASGVTNYNPFGNK